MILRMHSPSHHSTSPIRHASCSTTPSNKLLPDDVQYHCTDEKCIIAIVDDDRIIQNVFKRCLEKNLGKDTVDIHIFSNGLAFAQSLIVRHYDLILLDIDMPVMDGCQTAKVIRSLPSTTIPVSNLALSEEMPLGSGSPPASPPPSLLWLTTPPTATQHHNLLQNKVTPIIVITGRNLDQYKSTFTSLGVNEVLRKGVQASQQLIPMVKRFLSQSLKHTLQS